MTVYATILALAVLVLALAVAHRPHVGLWYGWPLALLLVPSTMKVALGSLTVDMRVVASLSVLVAFLVLPEVRILALLEGPLGPAGRAGPGSLGRPLLADALVLLLVAVQLASQYAADDLRPLTVPQFLCHWLLPYLMGRWYLRSPADVRRALAPLCVFCALLAACVMAESVTGLNVFDPLRAQSRTSMRRMGLKRASGPLEHPIYLGMMLALILPWALEAARRARAGAGPSWWRGLPWLMGGALVGTVSRGPMLTGLATLYVDAFFRRRHLRIPLAALALVAGVAAATGTEAIKDALHAVAGEAEVVEEDSIVVIDGEEVAYTGTNHRLLLYRVYAEPLAHAGWLGYGYELDGVEIEEGLRGKFWTIDSQYILFFLRHGYLGIAAFALVSLSALASLARAAWDPGGPLSGLAGALCGALGAVTMAMFSVSMTPDYRPAWLFCVGLASNVAILTVPGRPTPRDARP